MKPPINTGPPGNGRGPTGKVEPQNLIRRSYATAAEKSKIDCWIERRLQFLDREHRVLASGPIGRHYLRCAEAAYAEFKASRSQESRHRTWLAIRTASYWLAQLEKRSS